MNIQEADILKLIIQQDNCNQRNISDKSGFSLGSVNKALKNLKECGYIDDTYKPTHRALEYVQKNSPRNAIILAAGYGMRMVPINTEWPKAFIEVNGEPLIHRIINQLKEAGIDKIYVVVGFMKERFEYLIDDYGVELVVNSQYASKNNLHSMAIMSGVLSNTYIVPCDIWCRNNPFNKHEIYSWYMVNELTDSNSSVRVNRKKELVSIMQDKQGGNGMIGIAYLTDETSAVVRDKLRKFDKDKVYDNSFWEECLYAGDKMILSAREVLSQDVVEINTYEQLRELDENSNQLKSDAIDIIAKALDVDTCEITDIQVLKKGMTNRSFLFICKGNKYIMRIPGEGTDKLINRAEEAAVYEEIQGKNICDDIAYINPVNGYKITRYLEGARVCDSENTEDLKKCMRKLKDFHSLKFTVDHEFDIYKQLEFYETLWNGQPSVYRDYLKTKKNVIRLKEYIEKHVEYRCLTHIDAVPDNFLFVQGEDKNKYDKEDNNIADKNIENFNMEDIRLIDWEYAGMQDPHVDIAMFCIYSLYTRKQVDDLIDIYFEGKCPSKIRIKIYCYISACGLLWSNWCEYKRMLGVEFGEYSLRQYRYAKDYYKIVVEELSKRGEILSCTE